MRSFSVGLFCVVGGFCAGLATTVLSSTGPGLALPSAVAADAPVVLPPATDSPDAMLTAPPMTGQPLVLPATASIPSSRMPDEGPEPLPVGEPVSHLHGLEYLHGAYGHVSVGIWECSPGRWRRTIMDGEFAHFLSGHAFFTPDGGQRIEIKAGDSVWFPPNSRGIWDITETSRKTYILIGYDSMFSKAMTRLRSLVAW